MHPKVSIIILNWNGKEDTVECLESLKHITYPYYEILLADNGSTDGSVEYFKGTYPEVEIIENGENLGFAEGNNVAIRYALEKGTDYILLLNNDTVVDPGFLEELVKVSESDSKIAIVGPKVYMYDEPNKITYIGGSINLHSGNMKYPYLNQLDVGQFNKEIELDYISGCSLLIKKTAIDNVGILDPNFFLYQEDVDLCLRAKKKGYKVICVPNSKIWHKVSASVKTSCISYYYGMRNLFLLVKKNSTFEEKIFFYPYFFFKMIGSIFKSLLKRKKSSKTLFYIIYDIIKGNYGYQKRC
ncbi:glycosyltransferase family 2 protein [Methanococcoides sp. FTZ1]|uniref:glycosyltransferase family 2 protein n=1 Tax=Methanococcoides sp. FTZ1 TaxID=3439061 RepID=UPI003F84E84C